MSLLSTAMETSLWNPDHDWDVNQWRSRTFALPGRPGPDHFPNELLQELEWRRCAQDPLWFLCRHWHVLTPDQGIVPFRPFDYQAHSIDVFQRRRLVLILKARQIGYTALVAGFCMWWAIFKPASTVLYLSLRQEDADKVVRAMRDHGLLQLPDWMQRRVWQTNRAGTRIELSNASTLTTMPSQSNPARGQAASLIILDEWAFYANPEAAWASVGPAASVGGNVIALSSANGDGTPFSDQWRKARRRATNWVPMFFGWWSRPERTEEWYRRETEDMQSWAAAQEHPDSENEAFRQAGMAAFDHKWLDQYEPVAPQRGRVEIYGDKPQFELFGRGEQDDDRLSVWHHPTEDPYFRYVIGVDTSSGHGRDYSCATVLGEDGQFVAQWHGMIDADLFADVLCALGMYYRNALVGVERNGHGVTTVQRMKRLGYGNLFVDRTIDRWAAEIKAELGWLTSKKTKPLLVDGLASALRDGFLELCSQETIDECKAYRQLDTSDQFGGWPNDDRVIALGIAVQMLDFVSGQPTATGRIYAPEGSFEWYRERRDRQRRETPPTKLMAAGSLAANSYAAYRSNA